MTNFRIYDSSKGEFDNRIEVESVNDTWDVGMHLLLAEVGDEIRIFKPRFNFLFA
jgi:hypothetical protein